MSLPKKLMFSLRSHWRRQQAGTAWFSGMELGLYEEQRKVGVARVRAIGDEIGEESWSHVMP